MKQEKSCGAVVVDGNKVLIIKHNLGHWDFPKGHVELGETEEETAIREVKEETNVDIEINTKCRYVISYNPKSDVIKDVVYFMAKPITRNLISQEEEVSETKFVSFSGALELLTYDNSKEILKKIIKVMNN